MRKPVLTEATTAQSPSAPATWKSQLHRTSRFSFKAGRETELPSSEAYEPFRRASEESLSGGAFQPPASMQPDEGVLTREDLVPMREPVITRQEDSDPGFSAGEIERESTYGGRSSSHVESTSGDTRQITVPIELASLPASGKLKLVFEVRIEIVDSDAPGTKKGKKSSSRGGTMMRDLEVIPD